MGCCLERVDGGPAGAGGGVSPLVESNVLRAVSANGAGIMANLGIPSTPSGASSNPALASTNLVTSTPRARFTSAVGAGSTSGVRSNIALWWRGNAARLGGFTIIWRFAQASFVAGHRSFVGLRALTTQIPAVDPTTLVDVIGVGYDLGASQWSVLHNDGAGAATQVALGAAFNVNAAELLQLRLDADPNGATVDWTMTNLSSAASATGTISADLPAATTFLSSHLWANTGSDATTAALMDLAWIYAASGTG